MPFFELSLFGFQYDVRDQDLFQRNAPMLESLPIIIDKMIVVIWVHKEILFARKNEFS